MNEDLRSLLGGYWDWLAHGIGAICNLNNVAHNDTLHRPHYAPSHRFTMEELVKEARLLVSPL